jgi:hypothetical protein
MSQSSSKRDTAAKENLLLKAKWSSLKAELDCDSEFDLWETCNNALKETSHRTIHFNPKGEPVLLTYCRYRMFRNRCHEAYLYPNHFSDHSSHLQHFFNSQVADTLQPYPGALHHVEDLRMICLQKLYQVLSHYCHDASYLSLATQMAQLCIMLHF